MTKSLNPTPYLKYITITNQQIKSKIITQTYYYGLMFVVLTCTAFDADIKKMRMWGLAIK